MLPTALFLALAGLTAAAPNNKYPGVCNQGIYAALSSLSAYKPAREFCVHEFGHQAIATVTARSHKIKRGVTALSPTTTTTTSTSTSSSTTTKCTATTTSSAAACKSFKCQGKPQECMLSSAKCQKKEALKTLCSCIVPTKTVTVPCKTTSTLKKSTTKCTTSSKSTANVTSTSSSQPVTSSSTTVAAPTTRSSTTTSSTITSPTTSSSTTTSSTTTSSTSPAQTGCSEAQILSCQVRFAFCATAVADNVMKCPRALYCNDPCSSDAECDAKIRGSTCYYGSDTCGDLDKRFCAIGSSFHSLG